MTKVKDYLKDRTLKRYAVFVVVTAVLLFGLYFIFKNIDIIGETVYKGVSGFLGTLSPLFIGMLIAYLFDPLITGINDKILKKLLSNQEDPEKRLKWQKRTRLSAVLISYVLVLTCIVLIIYGFVVMIGGRFIVESVPNMVDSFSKYFMSYEDVLKGWVNEIPSDAVSERIEGFINGFIQWISESLSSGTVLSAAKNVGGGLINLAIGLVISIYLSYDKEFFLKLWNKLIRLIFPENISGSINNNLNEINGVLSQFLRGVLLDGLIVAILASIGFTIIGLDFAVFLGIFAGIANVIPYFGPVIGVVPAFFVGLLTGGFKEALLSIVVMVVVQQIDSNLIYPKVVGGSTGLHPLFVLLAVTIGGAYRGLIGMVFAVPIAGILQLFIKKWAKRREKKLDVMVAFDDENPVQKKSNKRTNQE